MTQHVIGLILWGAPLVPGVVGFFWVLYKTAGPDEPSDQEATRR